MSSPPSPFINENLRKERDLCFEFLHKSNDKPKSLAPPSTNRYSDISEMFDDKTCEVMLTPVKGSFTADEMSGRSTEVVTIPDADKYLTPGLDEIFRNSICMEVRDMEKDWRASVDGFASSSTAAKGLQDDFHKAASITGQKLSISFTSEEFNAAEKESSRLRKDEREWENEFATIPSNSDFKAPIAPLEANKIKSNLKEYTQLGDFSGYLNLSSKKSDVSSSSGMSVGGYFQSHSDDLFRMFPTSKSPPPHKPHALVDQTDINKENLNPMDNTKTVLNLGNLLDGSETPQTFMKKYEIAKNLPADKDISPRRTFVKSKCLASPRSLATGLDNSGDEMIFVAQEPGTSPRSLSLPASTPSTRLVRSGSQMSTGSEFSHRGGAFPVKSSHLKLSWGCIKLRTSKRLQLKLRNFINKRVTFRLSVSGPGFQLPNMASGTLTLQAHETHTLTVEFCPTVLGAAVGQITLEPPNTSTQLQHKIQLLGFGGKADMEIGGDISFPPHGNSFIGMGSVRDLKSNIQKHLTIRNRGNIDGFAVLVPDLKNVGKLLDNASISITPNRLIVPPGKCVTVTVRLGLRKEDLIKLFKKQRGRIIKVVSICCFMGDNIMRQRIKKCIHKLKENPDMYSRNSTFNQLNDNQNVDLLLRDVCENEVEKFDDDPMECVPDFIQSFTGEDIDLTLDRASDDTLQILDSPETTINFKSMILTEPNQLEFNVLTIEPSELEIVPCRTVQFYIQSESERVEAFEINSDFIGGLECFPHEGEIEPGETIAINAKLKFAMPPSKHLKIIVMYEKGKVELPITILPEGLPSFMR